MGKKTAIGLGAGIACLGLIGVSNAFNDMSRPPAPKPHDVTATGIVTRVHYSQVQHKLTGVALNTHYKLSYSFVADDGKEYKDTRTISEAEFNSLREGQQITVLYHSNRPEFSGARDYGTYVSVAELGEAPPPKSRLLGCLGACGFGACVIVASFFCKD